MMYVGMARSVRFPHRYYIIERDSKNFYFTISGNKRKEFFIHIDDFSSYFSQYMLPVSSLEEAIYVSQA